MIDDTNAEVDMSTPISRPDLARIQIETLRYALAARGYYIIRAEHVRVAFTSVIVSKRPNSVTRLKGIQTGLLEAIGLFVRGSVRFAVRPSNERPHLDDEHRAELVVVDPEGYAEALRYLPPLFPKTKGEDHD